MFVLDSRLKNDTYVVGQWPLSLVLLHRDSRFPWCILVPKRESMVEIHQLSEQDQQRLFDESRLLSCALSEVFAPDKLNIAAIGNIVKQLHIHHIARYADDAAWPAPVWGVPEPVAYEKNRLEIRMETLRKALNFP